jgi:type I pantothenate kinase
VGGGERGGERAAGGGRSPYVEFDREEWRALDGAPRADASARPEGAAPTAGELAELRSLGDPVDMAEVEDIYLPLCRLIDLFVAADRRRRKEIAGFLAPTRRHRTRRPPPNNPPSPSPDPGPGDPLPPAPFVIGIAGSVAVGKSTVARLLRSLLARRPTDPAERAHEPPAPGPPAVELVATDGFLLPNAVLRERGLLERKGFPESYDRRALLRFVAAIKSGAAEVEAPVYSHLAYDVVPDERQAVRRPDILILEGLNVLQPAPPGRLAVSDFFDFSIYVDARVEDIRRWYTDRFFTLRRGLFRDPRSYFHPYARVADDEAAAYAARVWRDINEANLLANILPTRLRATLVLRKGGDHRVRQVWLRRI